MSNAPKLSDAQQQTLTKMLKFGDLHYKVDSLKKAVFYTYEGSTGWRMPWATIMALWKKGLIAAVMVKPNTKFPMQVTLRPGITFDQALETYNATFIAKMRASTSEL